MVGGVIVGAKSPGRGVAWRGGVATLVGFKGSLNQRRAPSVPRAGGQMPGSWGGRLRGSGL